jgi:hypothetical protein
MTEPTAADLAQAREVVGCLPYSLYAMPDCNDAISRIAQALAAVRAQERARCVALVQTGWFSVQADPPLAVTVERLEGLRAQLVAALHRETSGTS